MARMRGSRDAFGPPGGAPRWTHGDKDGIGTAYSGDSRVWFTISQGRLTEIYYPRVDHPQVRDVQLVITDGERLFQEEVSGLRTETERSDAHGLVYRVVNSDPQGGYRLVKEVLGAPHLPCVLQQVSLEGKPELLGRLRVHAICVPHLGGGGQGNNGYVIEVAGRQLLVAQKDGVWLAMGSDRPFSKASCGYLGQSDGWTDLASHRRLTWEFDRATDGSIALTGELDLQGQTRFTLGVALGEEMNHAITALLQALGIPYDTHRSRYIEQWERPASHLLPLDRHSQDGGHLYRTSTSVLLAHEDKIFPGAFIASLSIPWGEAKSDEDVGGYHLVWPRDMVNSVSGLLAAGNSITPLRALIYLAATQQEDGGFAQNFWLDGRPYWRGMQLDQSSFPILLAHRLREEKGLGTFDPYPVVLGAACYLVTRGPATQQERWEEAGGYSPSTLAANIAALCCAASFARGQGDESTAAFLETYADFLESHLEDWTVTTQGTLHPEVKRHFIRILPAGLDEVPAPGAPDRARLRIANQAPGAPSNFPAKDVVDAGFLELVRYGIRRPDDPLVVDSLRVVDAVLKAQTPVGPCWRRYNHDGYGQREDGGPFEGWGQGRAWPLLTGERAHYELAAGRPVEPLVKAMERFATPTGLLPEQIWDAEDLLQAHMFRGKPTGSAMPLMWAHAEYVKLLRSLHDGRVFDRVECVVQRYQQKSRPRPRIEIWKANHPVPEVPAGVTLRIQAPEPFLLHWSRDEWQTARDQEATRTALGICYVDLPVPEGQRAPLRFTFRWAAGGRWEGRDYQVRVS